MGQRFPGYVMILFYSSGAADPYSILVYTSTDRPLVIPCLNRNPYMIRVNLAMFSIAS